MTLQERLDNEMKTALRSRDHVRLGVLRLMRAAIHNEEIARQKSLDDEAVVQVLARMARERREGMEIFRKGNRPDLAAKEEGELAVLQEYLPQALSREEIARLTREVMQEVGARGPADRGKVMGRLMPQLRGKADGSDVAAVVGELLEGLAGVG